MNVIGPPWSRLFLNAFVVVVGFLILAGAVNTAIIGSNGVLNRVAEDGVLPDWFLKPHRSYGTTYRLLYLIVVLQLFTIVVSRGDVILLGEAYAFGVVWSFVFKALAMVVLRFKDQTPREYKVPFNIRIGGVEIPIGLILIFLVLLFTAMVNLSPRRWPPSAAWPSRWFSWSSSWSPSTIHERQRQDKGTHHEHLEQFNQQTTEEITPASLGLNEAVPQAGGDPLAAQPVHAGKGAGRDRPGDDRHGGDDGQDVADRRRRTAEQPPTWTPTTSN